jgi:uncharacterized protein YjdB
MAIGRMFSGKKLAIISAFTVLLVAAFGAGCKGFFTGNTLNSIAIQPPSPTVEVGQTTSLSAWGTYADGTRSQVTSGVAWTSSDPTTILVDPNTGLLSTPTNSTGGTATITAAAQGLSATASATAYLGSISNFEVCLGTFVSGQSCNTSAWAPSSAKGGTQDYYVQATYNSSPIDLTIASTFGAISPTPTAQSISCSNTSDPATCTVVAGTLPTGTYTFPVTYGTTNSVTVSINLGP